MIVRCKNCNSAFAVDDEKVREKKFAFSCPKCADENIIDNRTQMSAAVSEPAVVDEVFDEADRPSLRKEAAVSAARDAYGEEAVSSKGLDHGTAGDFTDEAVPLQEDSSLIDAEDLSGLEEPPRAGEVESSMEGGELPPADDMRSEAPLDDLSFDDALEKADSDKGASENDNIFLDDDLAGKERGESKTVFEELGDEIGDVKADSELILDELEPEAEDAGTGTPVKLEDIDNIDELTMVEEKEKEIVDDYEPLDIEADTPPSEKPSGDLLMDQEIKTEEMYRAEESVEDESITIDLDSLDIDLDKSDKAEKKTERLAIGEDDEMATDISREVSPEEDENITIDLDSLDIDLQEGGEATKSESHDELGLDIADFSEETIQELEGVSNAPKDGDDEDIKLDLDSLDISLEETDEIKQGESLDDDEKLTLEDAGLTLEELTTDEQKAGAGGLVTDDELDDTLRLNIDDLDKDVDLQAIEMELKEAESILSGSGEQTENGHIVDELSNLPEIDFIEDLEPVGTETGPKQKAIPRAEDDLIKIDDRDRIVPVRGGLQTAIPDIAARGAVNFSIDYSIKYSRLGSILRILGLFLLGLIPHFLVFLVYSLLSIILGFINYLVVIATEKNVEDFSVIHENTLRYLLSISASEIGIIEEMPIFAGRDNIDYPLQMRIIFPLRSSRLLAFLRLSGIGIILLALPHFLILGLMSFVVLVLGFAGLLSVLITGGWPHLLFEFMTRYYRYCARVLAFVIGIVDVYPRFKFD